MAGEPPGVGFRVPHGFDAYLRIHHPLDDGRRSDEPMEGDGNLGDDAVDLLVPILAAATATPESCHYGLWNGWGGLGPGSSAVMVARAEGRRPLAVLTTKVSRRRAQRRYQNACRPAYEFVARCPVERRWGGRDTLLFDGAIDAVAAIGTPGSPAIHRRSPQWWWPDDRAWFLGTEIDDPWTYLGGSASLIAAVEATNLEVVRVDHGDLW